MALRVRIRGCGAVQEAEFEAGGVAVLTGPNGAGKTTLLRILAGIIECSGCEAILDGVDVCRLPPWERRVGYVPQSLALFRHMRVWENIAYGLLARGVPRGEARRRAEELARLVGVEHLLDRRAWMLSGGEAQRVDLTRALAVEPRLLLLDEALDHIDAATRRELTRLVARYAEEKGATVILVTHHIHEALSTLPVEKLLVMESGRLVYAGPPEGLGCGSPAARHAGCFEEPAIEACVDGYCLARCCGEAIPVPRGTRLIYRSPDGAIHPVP